jgi:hypothetical protein
MVHAARANFVGEHSHGNSTHSFAGLQTCGLFIRPAKPSHTAGTLK